jgi:hypothetical protein
MNCRPGDLAIFVTSELGNEGRIVKCLRLATRDDMNGHDLHSEEAAWLIDSSVPCAERVVAPFARDFNLRPIRDPGEDARDESAAWLPPVPTQTKEPA